MYDLLDSDRSDLNAYAAMAEEFGARSLLDVGCGTGTLACMLAQRGLQVTAIDPADASLKVAQGKSGAHRVKWLRTDAANLPPMQVDLAVMTGNVAQVFPTDEEWSVALRSAHAALRPGGRLAFESRDPNRKAWLAWTRDQTCRRVDIPGIGAVRTWIDLTGASSKLVSFRTTFVFERHGGILTSDSTLRFRSRSELVDTLAAANLTVEDVRGAPDRPGREMVFIARRTV